MKELLVVMRRSLDVMYVAFWPLFAGGVAWALVDHVLHGLVVGFALVGLFRVALRAARREAPDWRDLLAARDEPVGAFVAGLLFVAPFLLWGVLDGINDALESGQYARVEEALPGIPIALSLVLFVHFGVHVLAFAELAEGRRGVFAAFAVARANAEGRVRGHGILSGLGVHLALTSTLLLAILLADFLGGDTPFVEALLVGVVAPAAIAVLAAWSVVLRDGGAEDAVSGEGSAAPAPVGGGDLEGEP